MAFSTLYLTNLGAPYTPATLRGAWEDVSGALTKALEPSTVGGGAFATVTRSETSATAWSALLYRGVSGPLAAQTITGTLNVILSIRESAADADLYWHLHVYVTQGNSDTPRGTLLADYVENATNEWPTTATGRGLQSAQALSSLAVSDGDRLVVEIGFIARNAVTATRSGTLDYGCVVNGVPAGNLTVGSTNGTTLAGSLVFSASLAEIPIGDRVSQLAVELADTDSVAKTRVSQFEVETAAAPVASRPRLSQFLIEVAADAGVSPARLSQFAIEIAAFPTGTVRISQGAIEVARPNITPRFENVTVTGLTWMIVMLRSGAQYVWSDRPLPDPSDYYLGWKEPRVVKWGRIRRALSNVRDGQYETTDFAVILDDNNHVVRNLVDALVNATVAVYMIPDEGRRALGLPTTVYRGIIREAKPTGVLQYDLTIKDPFAEAFGQSTTMNMIPRRTIIRDDFGNCAETSVRSSAEGYVVDGLVTGGGSPEIKIISVRNGWGCFASGDKIAIGGESFIVKASSMFNELIYEGGSPGTPRVGGPITPGGDAETWIEVDPVVGGTLADGTEIVQFPIHKIEPAVGKRVPFPYGYITDFHVTDGVDDGDGQGLPLYVGDKVLPDGRTYGEFVWAGWACYSPEGNPFKMVYFWNNPLPYGFFFPDINSFSVEADVGGRICCPGFGNWSANGFTTSYVDYHDRRYTVIFLRGVFRDWALGLTEAPQNLGGLPFTVNAYGAEDIGNGSGNLITNLAQQYKHAVTNLCPPKGEGYQSGPWLTSPTFPDDPGLPMIDADSFDRADAQSAIYVDGGFRGDFIIGANNEAISARDLIARFNLSGAWQCGFNNRTQFFIDLINTDLSTVALEPSLGWVRDIFSKTFAITPQTRDLYTAIRFVHTQDYCGRTDWRSTTADIADPAEVENEGATDYFGAKTTYETLSLYMLRGKNRAIDSDAYARGSATITAVLRLTLARLSAIQHLPALQTGPAGFDYELADVLPITHYEGYGPGGWIDEPVRAERSEIDPSAYVTILEGYQPATMYGLFDDGPITWTDVPEPEPPEPDVPMGPPGPPEAW